MSRSLSRLAPPLVALGSIVVAIAQSCSGGDPSPSEARSAAHETRRRAGAFAWPRLVYVLEPADAGVMAQSVSGLDGAVEDEVPSHPPELVARLCEPLARSLCDARRGHSCQEAAGCVDREREGCLSWLGCAYPAPDPAAVVDPHRLAFCLQQMGDAYAQGLTPRLPWVCAELLVDPARPGEACGELSDDCVGGVCNDEGRCTPIPRGASCGDDTEVDEGGSCVARGCADAADCPRGWTCVGGECLRARRVGEPCDSTEECALGLRCGDGGCERVTRCSSYDDCGRGAVCSGATTDRCVPLGGAPLGRMGDECRHPWQGCQEGLACLDGRCAEGIARGGSCDPHRSECAPRLECTSGRRCEPFARDRRPGDACEDGACGAEGICVVRTVLEVDDTGIHRSRSRALCARRARLGESCAFGDDGEACCTHGLICEPVFDEGRCAPEICSESAWLCDID